MIFNIEKFRDDCVSHFKNVTEKKSSLNRMYLSRIRRGKIEGLNVNKFMTICQEMNVSPEVYSKHNLEF